MKNLIQKLFGARAPATPPKTVSGTSHDNPPTIQEGSENAIRHQLVQVLLRDVVRRHGIPPHWIDLQMLVVSSSSRGPGLYVRLVLKEWDQRLMNHAYALQNTLLDDIARFEPRASEWLHGLSWQLEFGDSCPYLSLPGKSFWLEPAKQAATTTTVEPATPVTQPIPVELVTTVTQATPAPQARQPTPSAQTNPENEALQDLERLFLIRDQELGRQADGGHAPVGYEKTQPSAL